MRSPFLGFSIMAVDNKEIGILHISDLHADASGRNALQERLKALADLATKKHLKCNYVVCTGDLARTGQDSEYAIIQDLLYSLCEDLELSDKGCLFVVPGNHDVDRRCVDEITEAGMKAVITKPTKADEVWSKQRDRALSRQTSFFKFASESSFTYKSIVASIENVDVGFACLNSAWRSSSDNDKGDLFLPMAQLKEEYEVIKDAEVKIALIHHPPSWLSESEQDLVQAFFTNYFHIVCYGHRHETNSYVHSSPVGQTYWSAARALHSSHTSLGFNHLLLNFSTRKLCATHWSYKERRGAFAPDTELADDGKHCVPLPELKQSALSKRSSERKLKKANVEVLERRRAGLKKIAPGIVEHLKMEDLQPTIELIDENRKLEGLNPIVSDGRHWLLTGTLQSGKSTILSQLAAILAEQNANAALLSWKKVPGEIERNELHSLAGILRVTKSEARSLLAGGLTLLFDDIDFSDMARLEVLGQWIKRYSQLRIIGSSLDSEWVSRSINAEGELPIDFEKWARAEIRPLSLRQIQIVVSSLRDKLPDNSSTQKLFNEVFESELPRHPWVVLLYLDACVRGAILHDSTLTSLMEAYVKLQVAGNDVEPGIALETAQTALEVLAARMMDSLSTKIRWQEAINALNEEANRTAVDWNASSILNSLVERGILTSDLEDSAIQFGFAAFQDYFYALYLKYHSSLDFSEMTLSSFRQIGGALAFLAEMVKADDIALNAFSLTSNVSPSIESPLSLEQLSSLGSFPVEVAEEIAKDFSEDEELFNVAISRADERLEKASRTHRARQQRGDLSRLDISGFLESFYFSMSILRRGSRLSRETKELCADIAVDCTISMLGKFLEVSKEKSIDHKMPDSEYKDTVWGVVTSILILFVGVVVADLGAGTHLQVTLTRLLENEPDPVRVLILLTWYSALGARDMDRKLELALKKDAPYTILIVLQLLFMFRYVSNSVYEGKRDDAARKLLRLLTQELVRRKNKQGGRQAINEETEGVLRQADQQIIAGRR